MQNKRPHLYRVLNPDKSMGYGPEVDLWSIGVITYILCVKGGAGVMRLLPSGLV
jgi:hypothetical protein